MITDLRLRNFRSYGDASFELSPGVNIVVGPNGSGKTNLLEALLVLSRGTSYRGRDHELVKFNKEWARLDSHDDKNIQRTVKIMTQPLSKIYEIDSKAFKRLNLSSSLPVVLFEPNHLQLLAGGPDRRRDYMDETIAGLTPGYSTTIRQYKRTLAQRNNLLKKTNSISETQVFPWNLRLSQLAGKIARNRHELTQHINQKLGTLYKELSQAKTKLVIEYGSQWPVDNYETQLLKKLETDLHSDRLRGYTASGPHREDLLVMIDDRPVQEIASRGEVRTATLALKITELQMIEDARETMPLLLLDDVFSELDGRRRHALTTYLAPYQTFITTTDADIVTKHFTDSSNIIALA